MDWQEYCDWLRKNGFSDNSYNYFRFHHQNLTPYAISKLTGVPKSNLSRYSVTGELTGAVHALFSVLNKLDDRNKNGQCKFTSLDMF